MKNGATSGSLDVRSALSGAYNVESACDLVADAAGFEVISFSERKKALRSGRPDRYYRHRHRQIRLWWECKSATDRLTVAQAAFLNDELLSGGLAGCGDESDLLMVIGLCARIPVGSVARRLRDLVAVMIGKGYRDVKRPRVPRATSGTTAALRHAGGARRRPG